MEHTRYVTCHRARFKAIGGRWVNIPYGVVLEAKAGYLFYEGSPLCATTSQNAYDYFAQDDDGYGLERGKLTYDICRRLARHDESYQSRWDSIWDDDLCQQYRRKDHEDFWLWNHAFYNAPIEDLKHIAEIIGLPE